MRGRAVGSLVIAVVTAVAGLGSVSTVLPSAAASPVVVAAGSPLSEQLMDSVLAGTGSFDVHARQSPNLTVPGDAQCSPITYAAVTGSGLVASPDGSDQGRDALRSSVAGAYPDVTTGGGRGCVDIARSDLGPGTAGPNGDNPTFEYYAFALDAVSWASPSLQAPATMTVQNVRDIYNCVITNWNQLPGGGSGPIQRFMPERGSGTRAFFVADVLNGIDPDTVQRANCPPNRDTMEENIGTDLSTPNVLDPTGSNAPLYPNAIVPYSASKFVAQATNSTNVTLDVRGGLRLGGLTQSGVPEYTVRWTGSAWLLNNATIVGGRTVNDAVTNGGTGSPPPSPIVTSAGARFVPADVGSTVSGTNIPPGAVIRSVDSATQVHLSIPTVASSTGGSLTIGTAVVSEQNAGAVGATNGSGYPGVRYVYNVVDSSEPSYLAARDLVGFSNTAGGPVSRLCDDNADVISTIRSNGFLDLPPATSPGGNSDVTCRLETPTGAGPPPTTTTQPPAPTSHPYFADSSPWNTKLPAGGTYADAASLHVGGWYIAYDDYSIPTYVAASGDPVLNVQVPGGWGWPATTLKIHAPASTRSAAGTDSSVTVVDGDIAYNFWLFSKSDATHADAGAYAEANVVTGSGWGTARPFLAAGIRGGGSSGLGGLIVGNELTNGISHALAISMPGGWLSCPAGYVAPAIAGDGSCEGTRLAIPAGAVMPSGLSVQGRAVWSALQTYGGYEVDTVGGATLVLSADPTSVPRADVNAVSPELAKIAPYLRIRTG